LKKLYLVRHAEADNSGSIPQDFYRPLTSRGLMDSARMGRKLAEDGVKPDLIISSTAERAIRTAETFADQLNYDTENTVFDETLYEGRMQEYMAVVNGILPEKNEVMIFAHNPIMSFLVEYLSHEDIGSMPTCSVFGIEFEANAWAEISKGSGKRINYYSPNHV
jgi:phosphohistidine phosphatase